MLRGTVQSAPPGVLGVDTTAAFNGVSASRLRALGYQFCIRYLSLRTPQNVVDLSAQEATAILEAGLSLVPVQHVLMPGWHPSRSLGSTHGKAAFQNAQQLGIPPGVNVWCDLEGIAPGTDSQAVIDYCDAWFAEVANTGKGYVPGLYIAYDVILNSQQLHALPFQHFWSAPFSVPVARRGPQMIQLHPPDRQLDGVDMLVDVNVTQKDALEGAVLWLSPG